MEDYQINIILGILSDALREKAKIASDLEAEVNSLLLQRRELQEQAEGLQEESYQLRSKLNDAREEGADANYYRGRVVELEAKVRQLEEELHLRRYPNEAAVKEAAHNYMQETGQHLVYTYVEASAFGNNLGKPNRIAMIKGIREVTRWGLKESKDYVDAWLTSRGISFK